MAAGRRHPQRPADDVQVSKGHGRLERRELWVVPAAELEAYLAEEYHGPQVRLVGQVRRTRWRLGHNSAPSVQSTLWIAGGALPDITPAQLQTDLRVDWAR
jgi:hypothetical protein